MYTYIYIYVYVHIESERERERSINQHLQIGISIDRAPGSGLFGLVRIHVLYYVVHCLCMLLRLLCLRSEMRVLIFAKTSAPDLEADLGV